MAMDLIRDFKEILLKHGRDKDLYFLILIAIVLVLEF